MGELLEKVREALYQHRLIKDDSLVVAAVSGGTDSLVLLHVLNRIRQEGRPRFSLHVAHLHHGLRGRSAREDAVFVRREAAKLGLPFHCGRADTILFQKKWGLSAEDAARRLRYRYLLQVADRIGASYIAVGHHRDDQVETVLLNLLRGTGPGGLAGMGIKRELVPGKGTPHLVRPLLVADKKEIKHYCRKEGLTPRFDESNLQQDYRRNRIRLELLPYLEREFNPSLRRALLQLAALMEEDRDYLESAAAERFSRLLLREESNRVELDAWKLNAEHPAMQGRVVRLAIKRLLGGTGDTGYRHVRSILRLCLRGPAFGRLDLPGFLKVALSYGVLVFCRGSFAQTEAFQPVTLTVPGEVRIPGKEFLLKAEIFAPGELSWPPDPLREAYLDYEKVLQAAEGKEEGRKKLDQKSGELQLQVRPRQEGERFHPLGAPGHKKLKDYFIDQKIPKTDRGEIPVVAAGNEAVWICGLQIAHGCRVTEDTVRVLRLSLEPL